MFSQSVITTGLAVIQIIVLAAIGYFLVKQRILDGVGLDTLSRMTVEVTLPLLIFCQLIKDFSFDKYANWWIFPLLSVAITVIGLVIGLLFLRFIHGSEHQKQFLGLVAFQNSRLSAAGLLPASCLKTKPSQCLFIFSFFIGI